jgi:hypothetical protein
MLPIKMEPGTVDRGFIEYLLEPTDGVDYPLALSATEAETLAAAQGSAGCLSPLTNRAYQPAIRSSRLARAASSSLWEREAGFRLRLYCRGEQPMTLLKAVLKALSDS